MSTAGLHSRSRGRRAALTLLVVTVAAAAVSVYLGRGYLVNSWWISQLHSENKGTRNQAAEKLAERNCFRAVEPILRLIADDPEEVFLLVEGSGPGDGMTRGIIYMRLASPMVLALWNMGEEALPEIRRASRNIQQDGRIRGILDALHDRMYAIRPIP